MSNEETRSIDSRSFEENKGDLVVVSTVFVVESCTAKCPTCQETCEYTAGHSGLHQCPNRHEWV